MHAPGGFDVVHSVSLAVPAAAAIRHEAGPRRVRGRCHPRRGVAPSSRGLSEPRAALARGGAAAGPAPRLALRGALRRRGRRPRRRRRSGESAVSVIPLGSDVLPGRDDDGATALLERLGVRGEFLLSVGTLEPRKNLPRLFEAYGVARHALPEPWPLVVVGPPGMGPRARAAGRASCSPAGSVMARWRRLYARARLLAYVPVRRGLRAALRWRPCATARRWWRALSRTTGGPRSRWTRPASTRSPRRSSEVATDDALRARPGGGGPARAGSLTWESAARAHVRVVERTAVSATARRRESAEHDGRPGAVARRERRSRPGPSVRGATPSTSPRPSWPATTSPSPCGAAR